MKQSNIYGISNISSRQYQTEKGPVGFLWVTVSHNHGPKVRSSMSRHFSRLKKGGTRWFENIKTKRESLLEVDHQIPNTLLLEGYNLLLNLFLWSNYKIYYYFIYSMTTSGYTLIRFYHYCFNENKFYINFSYIAYFLYYHIIIRITDAVYYLRQIMEFKSITQETDQRKLELFTKVDAGVRSLKQLHLVDLIYFLLMIFLLLCQTNVHAQRRLLFQKSLEREEFPRVLSAFVKKQSRTAIRSPKCKWEKRH